jgi:hypothetical protein
MDHTRELIMDRGSNYMTRHILYDHQTIIVIISATIMTNVVNEKDILRCCPLRRAQQLNHFKRVLAHEQKHITAITATNMVTAIMTYHTVL